MDTLNTEIKKRGRGRPRKGEIVAKKKPGKIGRPLGEAGIIAEYRARMLNSPKSKLVLEKVFDAALEDGHPHQAAAWKLVMDRIVPASAFDPQKAGGAKPMVNITITGVGGETTIIGENDTFDNVEDVEFKDV